MKCEIKIVRDKSSSYDSEKTVIVITEATETEKFLISNQMTGSYRSPEEVKGMMVSDLHMCLEEHLSKIEEVLGDRNDNS